MLDQLRGTILEKRPPFIVLDVQGVGYELQMPMICFYQLPKSGEICTIFTHFWIREDTQLLYGFIGKETRCVFRALIKVNGVGPKLALAILSGLSASQFLITIEQGDITPLVKLPGVGKKTAERLVVEMRDRCRHLQVDFTATFSSEQACDTSTKQPEQAVVVRSAVDALISLGYKPQDANRLVRQVMQPGISCEALIRLALRQLL